MSVLNPVIKPADIKSEKEMVHETSIWYQPNTQYSFSRFLPRDKNPIFDNKKYFSEEEVKKIKENLLQRSAKFFGEHPQHILAAMIDAAMYHKQESMDSDFYVSWKLSFFSEEIYIHDYESKKNYKLSSSEPFKYIANQIDQIMSKKCDEIKKTEERKSRKESFEQSFESVKVDPSFLAGYHAYQDKQTSLSKPILEPKAYWQKNLDYPFYLYGKLPYKAAEQVKQGKFKFNAFRE